MILRGTTQIMSLVGFPPGPQGEQGPSGANTVESIGDATVLGKILMKLSNDISPADADSLRTALGAVSDFDARLVSAASFDRGDGTASV